MFCSTAITHCYVMLNLMHVSIYTYFLFYFYFVTYLWGFCFVRYNKFHCFLFLFLCFSTFSCQFNFYLFILFDSRLHTFTLCNILKISVGCTWIQKFILEKKSSCSIVIPFLSEITALPCAMPSRLVQSILLCYLPVCCAAFLFYLGSHSL